MIEELRIRDLGVIADATLSLGPGFTAITGETGAGKTMVVTALGLLMGERSDAGGVRTGAAHARVGGLIRTGDPEVQKLVDELGGDLEDGDLTLTRSVSAEGRSRATVGGTAAPVGSLAKLAERLFAVHGQSEQLRLRSTAAQRETLDRFGGDAIARVRAEFQAAHRERQDSLARLTMLRDERDARLTEAAALRAELTEIEAVDPQEGEEAELRARIERLSNVEQLRQATSVALAALAGDSDDQLGVDAGALVMQATTELERVAAVDPALTRVLESVRSIGFELQEASRDLAGYANDLDQSGPGELEEANARLARLTSLMRGYPGQSVTEVLAHGAAGAVRLAELDGDDETIAGLESRDAELAETEMSLAAQLTAARTEAATRLSSLVTAELRELALPDAEFFVSVAEAPLGAHGGDDITLLLRPHSGTEPRPLARGASGGELSRVMLALEVVVAATDPVPTFVFDEVDAGVGGAAAIEIGRRLARLARTSQVIVVTHLAQVAAFANNHLQVVKDSSGSFTASSVSHLTGDARLAEMARLLSGLADSESALAHARELLDLGASG